MPEVGCCCGWKSFTLFYGVLFCRVIFFDILSSFLWLHSSCVCSKRCHWAIRNKEWCSLWNVMSLRWGSSTWDVNSLAACVRLMNISVTTHTNNDWTNSSDPGCWISIENHFVICSEACIYKGYKCEKYMTHIFFKTTQHKNIIVHLWVYTEAERSLYLSQMCFLYQYVYFCCEVGYFNI